jgi:peptidoglycan/LPS O-acetylase OafA/YrhL
VNLSAPRGETIAPPTVPPAGGGWLTGLDGIRGLAALYVVLYHTYVRSFPGYPAVTGPWWTAGLVYGHFAVVTFIVLSGFCLAASPARHGWRLGGLGRYASRRAWRILPPYWAALVFSLAVAWLVVPQPGQAEPNARSVLVHGLLLQNVVASNSPNRALWSIAVEAQLYVALPLMLLVVRHAGAFVMLGAVALVMAGIGTLASPTFIWVSAPDLGGLFAIGAVAAGIVAASERVRSWPWHWLALAAAAPVITVMAWRGSVWTVNNTFWVDLAIGPAIGCLLAAVVTDKPATLVRTLDSRPLRSLGSFSYSLYLTHSPIVVVIYHELVAGRVRQGVPSFLLSLAITIPATLIFAYLFAAVFELPFQRHRSWRAWWRVLHGTQRRHEDRPFAR